jgi:hypothetical protein
MQLIITDTTGIEHKIDIVSFDDVKVSNISTGKVKGCFEYSDNELIEEVQSRFEPEDIAYGEASDLSVDCEIDLHWRA